MSIRSAWPRAALGAAVLAAGALVSLGALDLYRHRGDRCAGTLFDGGRAAALALTAEQVERFEESGEDPATLCGLPDEQLAVIRSNLVREAAFTEDLARFLTLQHAGDDGRVDPGGLARALRQRDALLRDPATRAAPPGAAPKGGGVKTETAAGVDATKWSLAGPTNHPGRTGSIAIDPNNAAHIWQGSAQGGIWVTSDGGASWSVNASFPGNLPVSALIIAPTPNTNVMYAATGDRDGGNGHYGVSGTNGAGVYKSTDGGVTWTALAATDPAKNGDWFNIVDLALSPDGATLLAATTYGTYRSVDGGTTWTRTYVDTNYGHYATALRFDPNNAQKAVMSGYGFTAYSANGGVTWSTNDWGGLSRSYGVNRIEIAYAKATANLLFALVQSNGGALYTSTDGGQTWSAVASNVSASGLNVLGGQGWYGNQIWVDPTDSNLIVVGGIDLFRSINGGASFTKISTWGFYPYSAHADHHAIAIPPGYDTNTNPVVYFGTDGGVFKTANIRTASSAYSTTGANGWTALPNGMATAQFYAIAASSAGTLIMGGAQDQGTLLSTSGTTWRQTISGDGASAIIDQTNPSILYSAYTYLTVQRSLDGGATVSDICSGITSEANAFYCGAGGGANSGSANFIAPLVGDPNARTRLLGGANSLWKTDDATATVPVWSAIKPPYTAGPGGSSDYISAIAVAPGNSNIVWVGHNRGELFYTTNALAATPTWTQVTTVSPARTRMVNRITISATDPNIVTVSYAGYVSGNVIKTQNGDASWTDITGNLPQAPVYDLLENPGNANWLYAATEVGLFTSTTGGTTWSTSSEGPGTVAIKDMTFVASTGALVVGTFGRGAYRLSLITIAVQNGAGVSTASVGAGGGVTVTGPTATGDTIASYAWSATCTGGIGSGAFSSTGAANPTWTAPSNATGVNQTCTLSVVITGSGGTTTTSQVSVSVRPSLSSGGPGFVPGASRNLLTWIR